MQSDSKLYVTRPTPRNVYTQSPLERGLQSHVSDRFPKRSWTDFVIVSGGVEFNVHKNILCWQCDFFQKALDPKNGFKESTTGIIHMDDDPPPLIESFLQFLYTSNYKPPFTHSSSSSSDEFTVSLINFHVAMYQLTEKYTVEALQSHVARHFATALRRLDLHADPARFDTYAVDLIRAVYTSTPRGHGPHLREQVTAAVFQTNPRRRVLVHSKAFVALADARPEIWKDFLHGALGLVHISPGTKVVSWTGIHGCPVPYPWALIEEDSLRVTCEDLPEDRRAWTRQVLALSRKGPGLEFSQDNIELVIRMNESRRCANPAAYWKRWVRALMGVQCNPKTYRCEGGCGGEFEWALPTKAAREEMWPCRVCWKAKKTIDGWEDCVVVGGDGEGDEMDTAVDDLGDWAR